MNPERTGRNTIGRTIAKWLERSLLATVLAAVLTYATDVGLFLAKGKPVDQIIVNRSLAIPLKGNKTEYDYEGTGPVACSRSLFPQAGYTPCWYLRRHASVIEKL